MTAIAGACLVLLALAAAAALFVLGSGLSQSAADPLALCYVLGLGLAFGATGLAIGRMSAGAEPAQT